MENTATHNSTRASKRIVHPQAYGGEVLRTQRPSRFGEEKRAHTHAQPMHGQLDVALEELHRDSPIHVEAAPRKGFRS